MILKVRLSEEKQIINAKELSVIISIKGLTINNGSVNTKDIHVKINIDMAEVYEVNYMSFHSTSFHSSQNISKYLFLWLFLVLTNDHKITKWI